MTTWVEASEVCAGLVLKGRISKNAVRPDLFLPPYDGLIRDIKDGKTETEDLIIKWGVSTINAALDSIKNLNGTGEADWVSILEQTRVAYDAGIKLEKAGQRLQRGEQIDWANITYYAKLAQQNVGGEFTPLSKIKDEPLNFIPSGLKQLDKHIVGLPEVGLVTVGGSSFSGKTWFLVNLSGAFAKQHPNKTIALFSLEMMLQEVKERFNETLRNDETIDLGNGYGEQKASEIRNRILINAHPVTVEEIIAKSATIENLGMVGIDYADLLIRGETSESAMSHIYRTLMLGAKELGVPVIMLAQLSNYSGGIPRPNNFRWTRLAEALSWMVLMTYNPMRDWYAEEESKNCGLPLQKNTAFLLAWKVKGGFRNHMDDFPGAIMLPFKGDRGWGDSRSQWISLEKEG